MILHHSILFLFCTAVSTSTASKELFVCEKDQAILLSTGGQEAGFPFLELFQQKPQVDEDGKPKCVAFPKTRYSSLNNNNRCRRCSGNNDTCIDERNCCVDHMWRSSDTEKFTPLSYYYSRLTSVANDRSGPPQVCGPILGNTKIKHDKCSNVQHVKMVASCPKFTDIDLQRKCLVSSYHATSTDLSVAVINRDDSPVFFKNMYCAICNGAYDYTPVNMTVTCDNTNVGMASKCSFNLDSHAKAKVDTHCKGDQYLNRTCDPNNENYDLCWAYAAPVDAPGMNSSYANPHCQLCNNITLNPVTMMSCHKRCPINMLTYSFTLRFSLTPDTNHSRKNRQNSPSTPSTCHVALNPDNLSFDPNITVISGVSLACLYGADDGSGDGNSTSAGVNGTTKWNSSNPSPAHPVWFESIQKVEVYLMVCGIPLSIICYMWLILTYTLIKELSNQAGMNIAFLCISLLLSDLAILSTIGAPQYQWSCKLVAISLHYFLLLVQVWTVINAYEIYRVFTSPTRCRQWSRKRFCFYFFFASLTSATVVVAMVMIDEMVPGMDVGYGKNGICFVNQLYAKVGGYICIVAFVTVSSLFMLVSVIVKIHKQTVMTKQVLRSTGGLDLNIAKIAVKLTLLVGFVEIIGFAQIPRPSEGWQVFFNGAVALSFTFLRSLRGLFIWMMYIATKKVFKLYSCCGEPCCACCHDDKTGYSSDGTRPSLLNSTQMDEQQRPAYRQSLILADAKV